MGSQPVRGVGEEDACAFRIVIRQRGVEGLHREADLQVGDDEGGGHYFKAEHAFSGRLLDPCAGERAQSAGFQVCCDAAQRLGEKCARSAAWIQHVDVFCRQPVGDAEIVL